jgi:hypothetical protein
MGGIVTKLPRVRTTNIIQQPGVSELLLFDLKTNRAFCLNETSAVIYQNCDGVKTVEDLSAEHDIPHEFIFTTLDKLGKEGLIENSGSFPSISRRQLIKVSATTAAALPLVATLVVPSALNAQSSCVNPGGAAPGVTVQVCVGPVANCNLACQTGPVAALCCSNMSGLGLCGASCNCVCIA